MNHLSQWQELMGWPEHVVPLDKAALLIAASADDSVVVPTELARLDEMAGRIGQADAAHVCRFIFEVSGFRGDSRTYDDPRNSYLPEVLDRRLGIPITLSVLLMEIGRRCGVLLEGVGMPGHFLVRDPARPEFLIDSFSGGTQLDHEACAKLLAGVAGHDIALTDSLLAPVGTFAILTRMLANLDRSFRRRGDGDALRWVTRLRAALPGLALADQVALAETLAALGCQNEAATYLEELAYRPDTTAEAATMLQTRARGILAPFN